MGGGAWEWMKGADHEWLLFPSRRDLRKRARRVRSNRWNGREPGRDALLLASREVRVLVASRGGGRRREVPPAPPRRAEDPTQLKELPHFAIHGRGIQIELQRGELPYGVSSPLGWFGAGGCPAVPGSVPAWAIPAWAVSGGAVSYRTASSRWPSLPGSEAAQASTKGQRERS